MDIYGSIGVEPLIVQVHYCRYIKVQIWPIGTTRPGPLAYAIKAIYLDLGQEDRFLLISCRYGALEFQVSDQ